MNFNNERRQGVTPAVAPEILTVSEVAIRLRVAPSWVYGHADFLGAFRLGKYLRFDWGRLLQRLAGQERSLVGVAAQRPQTEAMNSEGCNERGTTREQK
jgi:hypothetical protein